MSIALNRYLAAKDKKGVRYCFVEEGARLNKVGANGWSGLVKHFRHLDYQTVLDGRPLLSVFKKTTKLGKVDWDELKRQTIGSFTDWWAEPFCEQFAFTYSMNVNTHDQ